MLRDLIDELRLRKYRAGKFPDELETALTSGFYPRVLTARESKWDNYDGNGEPIVRRLSRIWWRLGNETYYPPTRLIEGPHDTPIANAHLIYRAWADGVIRAHGGTPSTDPAVVAALMQPL